MRREPYCAVARRGYVVGLYGIALCAVGVCIALCAFVDRSALNRALRVIVGDAAHRGVTSVLYSTISQSASRQQFPSYAWDTL